jgi:hypothetical protein
MRCRKFITQRSGAAAAWSFAVITATLITFCCSSVNAEQAPREGCRAASKIEYDSAKKQYLLRNRVGMYVRTGRIWRRYYWYCRL